MRLIPTIILSLVLSAFWFIPGTSSLYAESETSTENRFLAGCWAHPTIPGLLAPIDGSTLSVTAVRFEWAESSFVCPDRDVSYQFELFRDESLTDSYYQSDWIDRTSLDISLADGVYYWRVRSKDNKAYTSGFSPPRKITIDLVDISPMAAASNEPGVDLQYLQPNASFRVTGAEDYRRLEYLLTYDSDSGTQGATGGFNLSGQSSVEVKNIFLGTCSAASCLAHGGITRIRINVTLSGASTYIVTGELTL